MGIDFVNINIGLLWCLCILWLEIDLCFSISNLMPVVYLPLLHWLGIPVWCWIHVTREDTTISFPILLRKDSSLPLNIIINVDFLLFQILSELLPWMDVQFWQIISIMYFEMFFLKPVNMMITIINFQTLNHSCYWLNIFLFFLVP